MFENLSEKLEKAFSVLKGHGKISEINVAETLKEVRRALLDADVSFKIAKEFTNKVKDNAIGQDVLTTLNPGQLMVKLVKDQLTELMGSQVQGINLEEKTVYILEKETGISPGQACVFYCRDDLGDKLLGGGWIDKAFNKELSTKLTS